MNSRSRTRHLLRPTTADLLLGAGLLVVAILSGVDVDAARPDTVEPDRWWQWLLIVTPALAVAVRRLHPVAATVVATTAQVLVWMTDLPEFLLALVVILYTAAAEGGRRGRRTAIAATVVLTAVTGLGLRIAGDVSVYQLPLVVLTCATAIALGDNAARQRRRAAELASQVTETRLLAEHERRNAITDERSAIARELHDVIGHTLATIAVRAEAADRVAAKQPSAAADALAAIADTARSSLDETRRVLAGLRESANAELEPTPDMASVRRLVTDLAEAGASVSLVESGCRDRVPPAVVLGGAFRIVQESLTNAVKHGGPDPVIEVYIDCTTTNMGVRVVNTVAGVATQTASPGSGVNGMAERAHVLGGTFDATRTDDQFTVEATLPTDNRN